MMGSKWAKMLATLFAGFVFLVDDGGWDKSILYLGKLCSKGQPWVVKEEVDGGEESCGFSAWWCCTLVLLCTRSRGANAWMRGKAPRIPSNAKRVVAALNKGLFIIIMVA